MLDHTSHTTGSAPRLGKYTLVRVLGEGAFGTVWQAKDTENGHDVAVKVVHKDMFNEQEITHIFREARAAEQLDHPNIVKLRDVGRCGDQRYLVSDFIDGIGLDSWLKRYACPSKQAAQWCATLARALQAAHNAGVIHRDLKPSNIMIDVLNRPFLLDFGLAKRELDKVTTDIERYQLARHLLRHQNARSRFPSGRVLGTPAYMPPEQARGDGFYAEPRSDIYSLGVVLYQMLTGRRPFRGSPKELLQQILYREPKLPRWINRRIPRQLEAICLKAMAKQTSGRYASADEMAEECERFLRGEPTVTRPRPRLFLTAKWLYSRFAPLWLRKPSQPIDEGA